MIKTLTTPVGSVEYSLKGKGIPVLFVHGGHSNALETTFHKGFNLNTFQLITPSRPGYGNTPLHHLTSPGDAAVLLHALLDALGLDKVMVVAVSAGGLTALELAARYPDRVEKLLLVSAVTRKWLQPDDPTYQRGVKMFSPHKEKSTWRMFRLFFRLFPRTITKVLFREVSTVKKAKISRQDIAEIREMTFRQRSGAGFLNDLHQDISEQTLAAIKCPTLILHSVNDKSVSIEMAYHANEKIKHSQLKTYDNKWGHLLWVGDDSQFVIKDALAFLRSGF